MANACHLVRRRRKITWKSRSWVMRCELRGDAERGGLPSRTGEQTWRSIFSRPRKCALQECEGAETGPLRVLKNDFKKCIQIWDGNR
jgi:hypothetical protein